MKRIIRWFVIALYAVGVAALAGCADRTIFKPINVDVPISEPCAAKAPDAPAWPTAAMPPNAGMVARIKALAAENELRKGYERQLNAALGGCTA